MFHPHQRCGDSDSPFARIHYFYTAGSRNEFGRCGYTLKRKLNFQAVIKSAASAAALGTQNISKKSKKIVKK